MCGDYNHLVARKATWSDEPNEVIDWDITKDMIINGFVSDGVVVFNPSVKSITEKLKSVSNVYAIDIAHIKGINYTNTNMDTLVFECHITFRFKQRRIDVFCL